MIKTAYIICQNESMEAVVLDDFMRAEKEKERMKAEHFKKSGGRRKSLEEYEEDHYWHIHEIDCI